MYSLFSITRQEHQDCDACEAQAIPAASIARVTGSTISAYADGKGHGARVMRIRPTATA